ncbi:MAG: glycosyltransferase [bacterium]|nr:glycosyltransferase [bacterium]
MKILFINTVDKEGGAALAAYRLSKALEKYHHTENYMIVGEKTSSDPNIFSTRRHKSELIAKTKIYIEFLINKITNKLGMQYKYFPFSTRYILKKTREIKPDIISLNNTHGGYFKTSLLKKLSTIAPIYWTLHDMWSFTANAAHTFGDESWKQLKSGRDEKHIDPIIGLNTGNRLIKQKKKIYKKSNLHIITPSRWLHGLAKEAPVFEGKAQTRITHGIDLEEFKPIDKKSSRRALGIVEDAKVFMFSSAHDLAQSRWKGGQLLNDILTAIDGRATEPIDILVLGRGRMAKLETLKHINVHHMGYIKSQRFLAILLSAADLFIYPTRADSLGLVLVEAIACGTPCITFDVGGCGDVIENEIGGYRIKPFDTDAFADKTLELLANPDKLKTLATKGRQWAETHFSVKQMAKNYYELFEKDKR